MINLIQNAIQLNEISKKEKIMKIDKTKIEDAEIISFIPYSVWLKNKNKTKQPKEVKNQLYKKIISIFKSICK